MKKVWQIEGLDCANCAAKLEDALSRIDGVQNVRVNYMSGKVTLEAEDAVFERVAAQVKTVAARVEPDAVIMMDEDDAHEAHHHEHSHEHHHEKKECGCGHEHHHDDDDDGDDCCCHEHHHHDDDDDDDDCCCGGHEHAEEKPLDMDSPVAEGSVRRVYPVHGLDCANCAAKLENELSEIDGIEMVRVSYLNESLLLVCPSKGLERIKREMQDVFERVEPDARVDFTAEAEKPAAKKPAAEEHETPILLIRVAAAIVLLLAARFLVPEGALRIVVYLAAYLCASYDVLWKAVKNISRGQIFDENFLMTVASLGAVAMQDFPEAIAVMALYQVGEWFQDRAVGKSRASIAALMDIRPDYANLVRGSEIVKVDPNTVAVDDVILVRPGEKVPLDGVIVEGATSLNTVALTGESLPRDVVEGDSVASGCVNLSGLIRVRVTSKFGDSTVARILELVETSGDNKAAAEKFISRFARYYTPAVCAAAVLVAVIPPLFLGGEWSRWIEQALSFLVISCPCALVISVPLSFFSGIGGASRRGILIKGANYMETLAKLDTTAFDKTGTLTQGTFSVTAVHPENCSEEELLHLAAHAESNSTHPISKSLLTAYGKPVDRRLIGTVEEIAGHGLMAVVDGRTIHAGNAKLMASIGVSVEPCEIPGTIVYVARDGQSLGHIVISDTVKPHAADAMAAMKEVGVQRLVMLTGDHKAVAEDIAAKVGLTEVRAGLLPEDKVTAIESLLGEGHTVGFVGDGINDAPVLRRADLGIAMGAMGSDAAIEAADVVLMDDDPIKLPLAIRIARKTMGIVRQNIAFALGVKALVLVLGALGIANMWLAVFADVGVAMIAILNAMRAMRCN